IPLRFRSNSSLPTPLFSVSSRLGCCPSAPLAHPQISSTLPSAPSCSQALSFSPGAVSPPPVPLAVACALLVGRTPRLAVRVPPAAAVPPPRRRDLSDRHTVAAGEGAAGAGPGGGGAGPPSPRPPPRGRGAPHTPPHV